MRWDPDWPLFRPVEFVVAGVSLAGSIGSLAIPSGGGRWTTVNDFDREARDTFRIQSKEGRDAAQDWSDIGLIALTNQLALDAMVVTWWGHGQRDTAIQMTLIDIEVLAVSTAINGVVSGITARQRPYAEEQCSTRPEDIQTDECLGSRRYRSFYSGHASTAFAAAGLMCMHHANLPMYGGGFADAFACAASFGAAISVGTNRVLSDQHWVSDIAVGSVIGTTVGLGLPYVLHYQGGALDDAAGHERSEVTVSVVPSPTGATLIGTF